MYTQCPDCQVAFRVTAQALRQAHGQVRCGSCGHTFDALDYLSEDEPAAVESAPPETTESGDANADTQSVNVFSEHSRRLLDSLDELAGGDEVRIEDTGVEWRVLDIDDENDIDADNDAGADAAADSDDAGASGADWAVEESSAGDRAAETGAEAQGSLPLDETVNAALDNNPEVTVGANEDHAATVAGYDPESTFTEAEDGDASAADSTDHDDVTTGAYPETATGEAGTAEDESNDPEPDDEPDNEADDEGGDDAWADDGGAYGAASEADTSSDTEAAEQDTDAADDESPDDPAATMRFDDHTPLPDEFFRPVPEIPADSPLAGASANEAPADDGLTAEVSTGDDGDWQDLLDEVDEAGSAAEEQAGNGEAADEAGDEAPSAEADADADAAAEDPAEAAEGDPFGDTIAQERGDGKSLLAATGTGYPDDDEEEDDTLVESIVMEGDTVTDLLLKAEQASLDDVPEPVLDDDDEPAKPAGGGLRIAAFLGVILLAAGLAAQYVHANRNELATNDVIGRLLEPVYAALDMPLSPAWDIRGWQFESTDDRVDGATGRLTISSRIVNRSSMALPYPLVHVSLTDRYDEVIGSRLLQPADYLAGTASADKPVLPGDGFTAVFTIDELSAAAEGFKLNVCYALAGNRLRCAIEDFRD